MRGNIGTCGSKGFDMRPIVTCDNTIVTAKRRGSRGFDVRPIVTCDDGIITAWVRGLKCFDTRPIVMWNWVSPDSYALTCLLLVVVFHSWEDLLLIYFPLSNSSFLPMVPELLHIQHSPSSCMQSKWSCKMFHLTTWKGFCEYISSHIFCRTVYQIDSSILYYKMNEMIPYVNVLCLGMIWSIFGECNSRLWVSIWHCRLGNRFKKFSYDLSKPQGFLWSISSGHVFRFSCRWCNEFLFLRWP